MNSRASSFVSVRTRQGGYLQSNMTSANGTPTTHTQHTHTNNYSRLEYQLPVVQIAIDLLLYLGTTMSYRRDEGDYEEDYEEDEGLPSQIDELAKASVPTNLKTVRACKRCGILKTQEQFYDDGCENCPFLDMVDNMERVNNCTTPFFEGQAAIMDPRDSWAAKWIRTDNFLPGVYAITVTGQLDREIEEDLENQGIRWRCRPANKN
jgi:transcription elongation factor SPT4